MSQDIYFSRGKPPQKPLKNLFSTDMYVVVIIDKPTFRNKPERRGIDLPNPPAFLEALLAYDQSKNRRYYLVKNTSGDWGWMKARELLISQTPIRSENARNPAFIKILAKNNWRKSKTLYEDIAFRKGPGSEYEICGKISIFRIRYLFKREKVGDDEYLFVGNQPSWNPKTPSLSLDGWIKRDFCDLWDNQVAVYYDKETLKHKRKPALIFNNMKVLDKYLKEGVKEGVIAEEENVYEALDPDTTRFPVLSHSRNMMNISWVGHAKNQQTQNIVRRSSLGKTIGSINRVISQIEKVDFLFLVDATKSMKDYYEPVANGIAEFIEKLNDNEKSRYRFAFGVYRDHKDKPLDYDLICDFSFSKSRLVRRIKETANKTFSKDKDFPEAIYQGIYKGVSKLFPDYGKDKPTVKGAFTRAVVVIGDHGNHSPIKGYISQQDVINLLIERHIAFYAINVRIKDNLLRFNQLFQSQMKSIFQSIGGENGDIQVIDTTVTNESFATKEKVKSYLDSFFSFSTQTTKATKQYVYDDKNHDYIRQTYGTRVSNHMLTVLKKFGWTDRDINLADFSQFCEKGWISKKDINGVNQLKSFCLIPRTKLHQLCAVMSKIKTQAQMGQNNLDELIREECKASIGDPILKNETFAEYLQRVIHIPFREISSVLKKTPGEIEKEFSTNDDYKIELKNQIDKKYYLLDMVLQDKTYDLIWNKSAQRWLRKNPKDRVWFFTASNGVRYCWLPFEYLP